MGKKSRKIAKTQQKSRQAGREQEIAADKAKMKAYMTEENYAKALETLAKLIDQKHYEAELMYDGAYAYFMLGDYPRAINWVNTTLTYAPAHALARILLGRICILEDRTEDGLAIFDFVLEHYRQTLPEEALDEMEEILEYYGRNEMDKLKKNYPYIADFLGQSEQKKDAVQIDHIENSADIPEDDAAAKKAKSMIAEMKSMMQAENEDLTGISKAEEQMQGGEAESECSPKDALSVQEVLAEIKEKKVSLEEKIRFCNAFAGSSYMDGHLNDARMYLQAAFEIDSCHEQTLRNLIQLENRAGNREQALEYASRLPWSDFALLDQIRDC